MVFFSIILVLVGVIAVSIYALLSDLRDQRACKDALANDAATADSIPLCPECSSPMTRHIGREGVRHGKQFWGCSKFPHCRATLPID